MKISKEIKTGVIAIIAIILLVLGVNFLKGNSFFGGDQVYYGYFPNSGGVAPACSIVLNGVPIGKIIKVEYIPNNPPNKLVKVSFNIQIDNIKIPKGSIIKVGSVDLFNKGILLTLGTDFSKGFYKPNDEILGISAQDMMEQVQAYADPIAQNFQAVLIKVDKVLSSFSAFWDNSATSELEGSLKEVKLAISRFGNVANEVELLVLEEKMKLGRIFDNLESITLNLKASNDKITGILGNAKKITDDLVTADFKGVIGDAKKTLGTLNVLLADATNGKGTLGLLLKDETLYRELEKTNKDLQDLVNDIEVHPERYIHVSLLGAKTKGAPLSPSEEKKLKKLLDSIPD
jgi:phospholipid/cholesterol/gamma-HCH transport system substrate-binding protein